MTRQKIIDFCLSQAFSYEDYPFDKPNDVNRWTVMRHSINKKSFALIYEKDGGIWINLKCESVEADFLRRTFRGVIPGFHMNKTHWNTVVIDENCDVPEEEIKRMIMSSYNLIKPKEKGL